MSDIKFVKVNFKNSYIDTVKTIGQLFLWIGILSAIILVAVALSEDQLFLIVYGVAALISCLFFYAVLVGLSTIIRSLLEIKSYIMTKAQEENIFFEES